MKIVFESLYTYLLANSSTVDKKNISVPAAASVTAGIIYRRKIISRNVKSTLCTVILRYTSLTVGVSKYANIL